MESKNDSTRLVDHKSSLASYNGDYQYATESDFKTNYKSEGRCIRNCCKLGDGAALRCIIVWMVTVAIVVFVALIIEIVNQDHTVKVGDIVTEDPRCTDIGAKILQLGGNAIDAAVAGGICATVTLPHLASLGGGGVMLIHQTRKNKTFLLDFTETVPAKFKTERLLGGSGTGRGYIGVPGFLPGILQALKTFGSDQTSLQCCKRYDLFSPTFQLLSEGFVPTALENSLPLNQEMQTFLNAGAYSNPKSDYAKSLRTMLSDIMEDYESFNHGIIAKQIENTLKDQLSADDMNDYKARYGSLLAYDHQGSVSSTRRNTTYQIITPGPPFTGVGLLALLSKLGSQEKEDYTNTQFISRIMENTRIFQNTEQDDQDSEPSDIIKLTSDNLNRLMSAPQDIMNTKERFSESGTNILVMDNQDNYVSLSLSLGSAFGSQVFAQGVLMNNALAFLDSEKGSDNLHSSRSIFPVLVLDKKNACGSRRLIGSTSVIETLQAMKSYFTEAYSNTSINFLEKTVNRVSSNRKKGWLSLQGDNKH